MRFLLLFGSPSVCFVQLSLPPLFLEYISNFFSFSPSSCCYVLQVKAGTPRQAIHHVWICSDTPSSQGLISQGEMGVCRVYILFPFLSCIKNSPSPLSFPPHWKQDVHHGKTDADLALAGKTEGKDLCRQTRIVLGENRNPNPPTAVCRSCHICSGLIMSVYLLQWFLFIVSLQNVKKRIMLFNPTENRCFGHLSKNLISTDHSGLSWGTVLEVMGLSFTIHLTSEMDGEVKRGTLGSNNNWSLVLVCDVSQVGEMEGEALIRKTETVWGRNVFVRSWLPLLLT